MAAKKSAFKSLVRNLAIVVIVSLATFFGLLYMAGALRAADISASNWSPTDASNTTAAPDGFPESMAPSGVNDAARAVMGAVKRFWNRINGSALSTGSANAYVVTYTGAPTAYVVGEVYTFRASFANTSTASANINSLGAKQIVKWSAAATAGLTSGDVATNQILTVVFDGTDFQMLSGLATNPNSPSDAQYIVLSANGSLTAERVLTAGTAVSLVDGTTTATVNVTGGKQTIWIPARAMIARTTTGAAPGTTELSTNKVMLVTLDFDGATDEFAQVQVAMPKSWNEGTISAQFHWTAASGSGTVIWGLQCVSISDDDPMDAAFGTAQTSTDTLILANDNHLSPETAAITCAGTPAQNDLVVFQVYRDADADGHAADAKLIGVKLFYTTDTGVDQ